MTLSGDTTQSQSGHGSNGNEEVLHIPKILLSDGLLLYPRHS